MVYQDFSSEEWQKIITLPQVTALYVVFASPSGALGLAQELLTVGKQLANAIEQPGSNPIIHAVAKTYQQQNMGTGEPIESLAFSRDPDEIKALCLETCREVAALLERHTPADAEGYKRWVYEIATASAAAASEGGFLGIGGVRVNLAEEDALFEIASALDLTL